MTSVRREVVLRNFNGFAIANLCQVVGQQLKVDCVWVVEVYFRTRCRAQMRLRTVVVVAGKYQRGGTETVCQLTADGRLAAAASSGDSNHQWPGRWLR